MKKKRFFRQIFNRLFIAGCALLFSSCTGEKSPLKPVNHFDAAKYMGVWYEIARTPNPFEKNLSSVTATYTLEKDGSVKVVNSGFLPDGKRKNITGKAIAADKSGSGSLKVTFFPPFYGEYKIVKLAPDYRYSVVVSGKKYLWILSRTAELSGKDKKEILSFLEENGIDTGKILFRNQESRGKETSPIS